MGQKRRIGRLTRPVIYVFCEGETEEQYVKWLRMHFRVAVKIFTKVVGTKITPRLIDSYLMENGYTSRDMVFFVYDGDRGDIVTKLNQQKIGEVILSNPCFELWILLHYQEYCRESSSNDILKALLNHCPNYTKGIITRGMKERLSSNLNLAVQRAISLNGKNNPSTEVYQLIAALESNK